MHLRFTSIVILFSITTSVAILPGHLLAQGVTVVAPPVPTVIIIPAPIPLPSPAARSTAPLLNLSIRTSITVGQTLTLGFVVGGSDSRRVLIRAVGPSLAQFGTSQVLQMPYLTL